MIYGMGCDLAKIDRVNKVFDDRRKLERCFTEKEISLFSGRPERVAGNFAAKEALAKALGTGFRGFSLKDVEILRDELGRPYLTGDSLRTILAQLAVNEHLRVHLSISHEREYAMATCILERVKI
ncbi:holo-ACP synthase [Clostridiaceae bacterium HFYG-1003]|nr:holo-ACP synthase [Clostridiaceae bacterium HFYG-1003]